MSKFAKGFVKMESKLSEFGMGCLECNPKQNPKVVKFHAVAPKINQQRHRHQCCILFFFPFDLCLVFLSPKFDIIFDIIFDMD
jgi:hypothetical protein